MLPRRPTYRPAPFYPATSAGGGGGAPRGGGGGLGNLVAKGLSIYELADKLGAIGSLTGSSSATLPTALSSAFQTPFSFSQYATPVGNTLSGGAGAASTSLASVMPFLGPAVVGALAMPALGAIYGQTIGAGPRTNKEQTRMRQLAGQGYKYGRDADFIDRKDSGFRADLAPDFVGRDSKGTYVNNRFARSRNEADLTPETISEPTGVGRAGFIKEFGNAWDERLNDSQRNELIQDAINRKLIDEKRGSVFLRPDQDLKRKALYMMNGITF